MGHEERSNGGKGEDGGTEARRRAGILSVYVSEKLFSFMESKSSLAFLLKHFSKRLK